MNEPVKIYFDGGCRPNPGAIEIAVVIRGVVTIERGIGHGDNEDAEWTALLRALDRARTQGLSDVILIGDALSVIRQAKGVQRGRHPWIDHFGEAARGFDRLRLRHIRRHQNLAGIALDRARFGAPDSARPAIDSYRRNDS